MDDKPLCTKGGGDCYGRSVPDDISACKVRETKGRGAGPEPTCALKSSSGLGVTGCQARGAVWGRGGVGDDTAKWMAREEAGEDEISGEGRGPPGQGGGCDISTVQTCTNRMFSDLQLKLFISANILHRNLLKDLFSLDLKFCPSPLPSKG